MTATCNDRQQSKKTLAKTEPSTNDTTLAAAAVEYRDHLLVGWQKLSAVISGEPVDTGVFARVATNPERGAAHHRMLRSYALHDYTSVAPLLPISPGEEVFDAGGGDGTLAQMVQQAHPQAQVIAGDLAGVGSCPECLVPRIDFDLFAPWPVEADKILLARVLHDWDNNRSVAILEHARRALACGGEVLVLEMIRPETGFAGAMCSLHLLATTGGKERTETEFRSLFEAAGLCLSACIPTGGLVSILRATR